MAETSLLDSLKPSYEKTNIRRWIITAVSNVKGNRATIHHIRKYLDSKKTGLSNKPETKLIMKKLLDIGRLVKVDGKYALRKSKFARKLASKKAKRRGVKKQRSLFKKAKRPGKKLSKRS
ncbi:hypothetical protein TNCT_710861 [Trichonephila clavata]|uniref:Uncharacterized protein n=1 Tax=Trichonephila clavata TaxID=2740835 RepID=A0A8X6L9I5_TRICU|nr:hypothetical protein TNCT_710861 [Trichonephila clavata]